MDHVAKRPGSAGRDDPNEDHLDAFRHHQRAPHAPGRRHFRRFRRLDPGRCNADPGRDGPRRDRASAVLEERVSVVPSVAQGEEGSDTQHYQGQPAPYLDVDLKGTSTVDADGLHSSIEVGSVHVQPTEEDLGQTLAQEDTEDVQSFGTLDEIQDESADQS